MKLKGFLNGIYNNLCQHLNHKVKQYSAAKKIKELTRKLTKLAPKLIKGLWFLKEEDKEQVSDM